LALLFALALQIDSSRGCRPGFHATVEQGQTFLYRPVPNGPTHDFLHSQQNAGYRYQPAPDDLGQGNGLLNSMLVSIMALKPGVFEAHFPLAKANIRNLPVPLRKQEVPDHKQPENSQQFPASGIFCNTPVRFPTPTVRE